MTCWSASSPHALPRRRAFPAQDRRWPRPAREPPGSCPSPRTSTTTPRARCGRRRSSRWSRRCAPAATRHRFMRPDARRGASSRQRGVRWRAWWEHCRERSSLRRAGRRPTALRCPVPGAAAC
eukprot:Mycagemm_TRINITY_DN9938_c0_g1::TRINITY_DN9938_c0_g1_i1::g.3514::m.3514 type:complete len:123 gc:universal TRINITY_DN9938_c0_g1_i1:480-112(-)